MSEPDTTDEDVVVLLFVVVGNSFAGEAVDVLFAEVAEVDTGNEDVGRL